MAPVSDTGSAERIDERKDKDGQLINQIISWGATRRAKRHRRALRLTKSRSCLVAAFLALAITAYISSLHFPAVLTDVAGGSSCTPSTVQTGPRDALTRVALVDQLALQYPNPGFVESVRRLVTAAGYGFDYFPPDRATLDFFLSLPEENHSIVILRTHGTGINAGDRAAIATSDSYSKQRRVGDQLFDRLIPLDINGEVYFGLTADFITKVICGRFQGTVILSMWCSGGGWIELARAFVDKGAGAYIGWNGRVTVDHTDMAFQMLLDLFLKGYPAHAAVQNVMERLGPDPWTGAKLVYHV